MVVVGFAGGHIPKLGANLLLVKNISAAGVFWGEYMNRDPTVLHESLRQVLDWWRDDVVKPHVGERLPLDEQGVNDALEVLGCGASSGKVVVDTTMCSFDGLGLEEYGA